MVKLVFSVRALVILILGIVVIGVGVYAYNTNSPSTFGHTISELDPPYQCNGYLKFDATNRWTCGTPSSSGGSTPITCTGTNKVLQWTGSSWVCATVSL
jgi:hypothetical protein